MPRYFLFSSSSQALLRRWITFCFLLFFFGARPQKLKPPVLDSLLKVANANKKDTGTANAFNRLSLHFRIVSDFKKALNYAEKANELSKKTNFQKALAYSYNNIGLAHKYMGDYSLALTNYGFAKAIYENKSNGLDDYARKMGLSATLINIGSVYSYWGNNAQALEFNFKALKIKEEMRDEIGMASVYHNIGLVYSHLEEIDKALSYHFKALELRKKIGDKVAISSSIMSIGICYFHKKEYEKTISYYEQALDLKKNEGDIAAIEVNISNLAGVYATMAEEARLAGNKKKTKELQLKSLDYAQQALELGKQINDKSGIASALLVIAEIYMAQRDYTLAEKKFNEALRLLETTGNKARIMELYLNLASMAEERKNGTEAYNNYKKYIVYRDSITNEENTKNAVRSEMKFDFDKKQSEQALEQKRIDAEKLYELEQQKTIAWFAIAGALLVFVLLGVAFVGYRNKKKSNKEIVLQKKIIEEKAHELSERQKEILDSINYAQRLQLAILSTHEEIKKFFPESFVLYKPKDIVAGDFYFFEVYNSNVFLAAADCTGHGVPGALVSIVCANALSRAIKEFGLVDPGKILDKTRELVVETFMKSGKDVKDGMDISFLTTENFNDKNTRQLKWAGANNPAWIFSEGEMKEIKADKQPVGLYDHFKSFTTHQLPQKTKENIYLFTDGYADQFGGAKGKKFKYRQLQELLVINASEKMEKQSEILLREFEKWKGNVEQVDDVCVIGIQI